MADWTNLPNAAVGVGGLPSGTTVTALRDNPVAIAEGAAGAPRVSSRALGGLILPAFSAISNNWAGLVDLGDFNELTIYAHGGGTTGGIAANVLEIRFSTNNGSTWGPAGSVLALGPSETFVDYFTIRLNLDTGANTRFFGIRGVESAAFTIPSGTVNGFQMRGVASGIRGSAIVTGGRS